MRIEEKLKVIEELMYSQRVEQSEEAEVTSSYKRSMSLAEPIAIIGMSGYLPKSKSLMEFWAALDQDKSLIEEIPSCRFKWDTFYSPNDNTSGKMRSKWGGFIPNFNGFDAEFFNIEGKDATLLDPRFRLLAMAIYSCLEDAGYAPEQLKGNGTGVFVGVEDNEYILNLLDSGVELKGDITQHSANLLANHLSYLFDFRGPSETINTMSSSSSVAIHRAVTALRNGEINQAIVGGANLFLRPELYIAQSEMGMLSPSDTVNSFGKNQQGTLYADTVASIALKPLSNALKDGDDIYAIVKETTVNFSGRGGGTFGTPDVKTHSELVYKCYKNAGIDARNLVYIEAQGMGSPVPDFVEFNAFNKALMKLSNEQGVTLDKGSCLISTLKPMMGHAQAASGLASVFKVIKSFRHNKVHKILNFEEASADLDTNGMPCSLATETQTMRDNGRERFAGVHSFGSSGTNAHLLVEEYIGDRKTENGSQIFEEELTKECLFVLSARTASELRTKANELLSFSKKEPLIDIRRVAYTLQVGRKEFSHRLAFVASSHQEFEAKLTSYTNNEESSGHFMVGCVTDREKSFGLLDLDEDIIKATESWMAKKKYSKILTFWVNGVSMDWLKLYNNTFPKKIHLPTYPFSLTDYSME